ncbi:type II toxin-antitoxin system VapB family antitoxin [Marinoscillum sp. MHG1-6]|uniref:type II toxin-antitoxin system VapB family antitoxin n=1 Tax=Marinoscillum sp. MHG1-6 TaxID=2959627 RepID=UPI0021577005|nr:type II toxin-antitoxin system VapB family antitoxin [Marinoscillum sp. MHG1-6]
MRTTLDLPEDLIKQAMEVTGAKTKSQVIRQALEDQIKKSKRLKLLSFKGKIDLSINLDDIRDRNK